MPYPSLDAQDRPRLPVTVTSLTQMRARQEPIAMLTAYDASFAALADRSGVDVILIGDSLGMVCQGHKSTLAVQLADVAYHTQSVVRGLEGQGGSAMVLADMPFASYHASVGQAIRSASTLMQAGAHMVSATAGQVLVLHDMLGIRIGKTPRFVKDFMAQTGSIEAAMKAYVREVKDRSFPVDAIHGF
ncbi:MAG: hypothetical protein EBW58_00410 [Betaproteobacteria bacterium]|nr:hypothetical protein [Betaproteobacteria bacterium]